MATPGKDGHRDAQTHEALALKLRKLARCLEDRYRHPQDIGELNSQLASLDLAAETLEWLAREDRVEARDLGTTPVAHLLPYPPH